MNLFFIRVFAIILRVPVLIGITLLAVGLSLLVAWWSAAFVAALQVLLVLLLLFCGAIVTLTGYSAMKAQRDLQKAIANDDTLISPSETEASQK